MSTIEDNDFRFSPLHLYILLHIKKAGVEYANMISKTAKIPLSAVRESLEDLLHAGFIERDSGSAIKRSKARFKKAHEVHKHHTYYLLSRDGEMLLRSMDRRWFEKYFRTILEADIPLSTLLNAENLEDLCSSLPEVDCRMLEHKMRAHHLITSGGKRTDFFKMLLHFLADKLER